MDEADKDWPFFSIILGFNAACGMSLKNTVWGRVTFAQKACCLKLFIKDS